MPKDTYYFSHDSNARNDEKILAVRMRLGMEGYGIYFAIIEKLREANNYMCFKDYNVIAFELRVGADKVKSIVEDFNLFDFSDDNKFFFSESLIRRMIPFENLLEQRRAAGKKSAEKRWGKSEENNKIERPLKNDVTTVNENYNKGKESKEKEIKYNIKEINKENFNFNFCENPEFKNLLFKWIDYKREIKSEITSQIQVECAYKDLFNLSSGNSKTAEEILTYSINGKCKNFYKREKNENNGKSSDLRNNSKQAKVQGGYGEL